MTFFEKTSLSVHRPTVFHLVAHATSESFRFQAQPGPTYRELNIHPKLVAAELGRFGVWVAVFDCCDSASAPSDGSRPPAYEIAERTGATTIGMSGLVHPYMGGLFAATFYRNLENGFSAVQAYHEAVCSVREHSTYSAMWSIPVMYSGTTNVIPFPVGDEARARLGFEQIRLHVQELDDELQRLARRRLRSSGEWHRHTATPLVRMQCIGRYLGSVTAGRPAVTGRERRRQMRLAVARDELRSALSAAAGSLRCLSDPAAGAAERQEALDELPLYRTRHQRILTTLEELFREAR